MTLSFLPKALGLIRLALLLSLLSLASAWGIGPDQDLRATDATSFVLGDDSGYGSAIVTAGDWMAVGTPGTATDNTSTYAGGRVFLWKHESGAWQMKQQLTWPEPDAAADPANAFGRRLALRGTRLLVSSASPLGKVFVFDLVSGVWTLSATLTPQGSDTAGAGFGDALALSASGSVAVIGSPTGQSEGETSPTGWLDVYEKVDSAWLHRGRLTDPLHGAGLGKTLTLHGDTIIAGRPQSTGGAGSVAIFERSGDVWSQTQRLLPPNSTALYGSQVLAYADRLFVLAAGSGGGSGGSGNGALLEYSLPDRSLLATVTVSLRPAQGTPLLATDGTRLAICSPGLNASLISLLVRGQAGSWSSKPHNLTYSYSSAPQFDKKALAFRSGELLLGGSATQTFYLGGDTDTTSTHWTVRAADDQTPGYSNYWMDKGQVVPMSRSRLDVLNFGYSTAWDGQWLVVGTPNTQDSYQPFLDGFVSVYRRTAQGSLQFHSFLPEPAGVRGAGQPAFGQQVSLSGSRIAVGRVLGGPQGPQSFPGVLIYAWDASLGQWLQEAHLTPPEDAELYGYDFGRTLSLSGDRLAIGAAEDGAVFIYRRTGTQWSLESRLGPLAPDPEIPEYFGRQVCLSGTTLLVTSDTDAGDAQDTAYFYELKQGTWTRVASFPRPASQTSGSFATSISLEGDRALIARETTDSQTSPAALYQRSSGVWKHHSDLPADPGPINSEPPVCLSGTTAILGTLGVPRFHTLSGTKWIQTPSTFAEDMSHGFAMADGMLIGATWGRRVQVRGLTRVPDIYVYADSVSWSQDGSVQHLDLGEYLVGTRTDQVATLRFFHQGSTSVRCTITPSGDVADFTPSATSLSVPLGTSPLKAPEMFLRFAPKTTGPKELTLTITTGTPHETPQVVIIRAQVVAQAQPVTFLEQPQPELRIGSAHFTSLHATVQGTRPMTYRWTRNGSTLPLLDTTHKYDTTAFTRSGGTYQLEVTNPAGKFLSDPAGLAWVKVKTPRAISLVGKTAQAELEVDGPVKIRWHRAPDSGPLQPLSDGGRLSGTTKPVLKITQGEPQDTGRYTAQITLDQPGDEPPSGQLSADIHIVSPLLATLSSPTGHTLPLNVPATLQCGHQLGAPTDHLTAAYTITGFPPGLRENPARDGEIIGTPTKAGLYLMKITAKVGPFTSAPFIVPIVVKESALATPGIYWGLIPPGLEHPLGGAVTVDLQPSGALTGTLQTGAQRTSFTSLMHQPSLWRSDNVTHTKHIFPSGFQRSWLQHIPEDGSLDFRLVHVTQPIGISVPPLTRLRLMKPLSPATPLPPEVLGTHSVAMLGTGVGSDTVADVPAGHSFGTLTIKADRSATLAGQLADGSTLTGTGWYSQDQPGRPARLHLYAADKTGRSSLRGIVPMLPEEPDPEPDPDPEPESELTATAEDTPHVLWSMDRSGTSRTYPEGFYDQRLPWITSRYAPKVPWQGLTPGDKYLWLSPPGREPLQIPFALSSKLAVIPSTGPLNPWGAKLTLPPATGLFTGTYTLQDPDPVNPGKTLTRSATFKGIYLPRQRCGYGYSLVPDLPDPAALPPTTSLKDTPVPSSAVEIIY